MHVHLPKPLHGWREFAGEVGIIVLGVLIALGFEQLMQSVEWRHKVDASLAEMNNELGLGDGPQAYARVAMHDCIATRLDQLRNAVERGDRGSSRNDIDAFWLPKRTWDSLARDTATASDVSSHMPHQRELQYRIAYSVVPDLQRLADKELADLGDLRALPTSGGLIQTAEKLPEIRAIEALRLDNDAMTREATFILVRLKLMDLRLDRFFVARDVLDARSHFGACIVAPRLPTRRAILNRI